MIDPKVALQTFFVSNFSCGNPTTTQMSGRIFTTGATERPFVAPSLVIGPVPQSPAPWLSQFEHWYKTIVPVTAYTVYDPNPLNVVTTERDAKIARWNLIDSARTLIANNKNLSGAPFQVVHNEGYPHEANLTKWRPGVLALTQNVVMEFVEDITNQGSIP